MEDFAMSHEMEVEDYLHQCRAECAALREQIDNLVAFIRQHEEKAAAAAKCFDDRDRLLAALDESLARERARNERDAALRAEAEALEL
jgi:hypothetical protein